MRMVRSPRELQQAMTICRSEALAAFGDDSLYLERWLEENRHVEVQVVVDRYGNGVHVGERDCSVQRRHQKVVEEAPTPALTEEASRLLCESAVAAVVAAGYENLGTLEFLVDRDGASYFIEINCRIQVEHPVTEMLSGIDLVAEQIRIAAGEPLGYTQDDVRLGGHAIEFRINAEDVSHDFRPQAGTVGGLPGAGRPGRAHGLPPVQRLRSAALLRLAAGQALVWAPDRPTAIARARVALTSSSSRASSPTRPSTGRSSTTRPSWTAHSRPTCSTGSGAPPSWPAAADPEALPPAQAAMRTP